MTDYLARFDELIRRGRGFPVQSGHGMTFVETAVIEGWVVNAINLMELTFGTNATLTVRLKGAADKCTGYASEAKSLVEILAAAREEYSLGMLKGIRREVSDELVVDLCLHAESLLEDGYEQPAAVLAAAALEEGFKIKAESHGIDTTDKGLPEYINALKAAGVLSGATAKLAGTFPQFRNAAMHADWQKISAANITGITGFMKTFVVQP